MLSWRPRLTLMLTGTTKTTTWAAASAPVPAVSAPSRKTTLRVRPYSVARPRGVFLAAELALLTVVLLATTWVRGTLEAALLITLCGLFFHVKTLDRSIVGSEVPLFFQHLFEALAWAAGCAALVFYLFPSLASVAGAALTRAGLAGLRPDTSPQNHPVRG